MKPDTDVIEDAVVFKTKYHLTNGHPALKKGGTKLRKRAIKVLTRKALKTRTKPEQRNWLGLALGTDPVRNTKLFNRIADAIEYFPESYDQSQWGIQREVSPVCGTSFCIAGHGAHETGWKPLLEEGSSYPSFTRLVHDEGDEAQAVSRIAAFELGLTENEAELLFGGGWEPDDGMTVPEALRALGQGARVTDVCAPHNLHTTYGNLTLEEYERRGEIRIEGDK